MRMHLFITFCMIFCNFSIAQNVGIGTSDPQAGLHIITNNGLLATGILGQGAILSVSGVGTRMIWYSRKAAFRAGTIDGGSSTFWDDANIGNYSVAMGLNTRASGQASVALGQLMEATATNSIAIGYATRSTGNYGLALGGSNVLAAAQFSVAIGNTARANSFGGVAIGRNVNAGAGPTQGQNAYAIGIGETAEFTTGGHYAVGDRSFVFGNNCAAVGNGSFAIGNGSISGADFYNSTLGFNSYAFGNSCRASGNYSFAFGNNANTNGRTGSFVMAGRTDGVQVTTALDHHLLAQFAGGFHFQTTTAANLGVYLNPNGNAWLSFCDSNLKEQILPLDDEEVLEKVSAINYTSWRYKGDPDPQNRHYGVMAQDFFAAFGKDALGNIGNDTAVNPIDLLGIAFSAIKALEKRTEKLEALKQENAALRKELEAATLRQKSRRRG
ncbi:MAG TPA: tail fiber domain-containing protein [Phnomibacter sp.]|nr:tail fiber domain-containing protein [Phnomibacter sp.]